MEKALFFNSRVVNDIDAFNAEADQTLANRASEDLAGKVFTRDLFGNG